MTDDNVSLTCSEVIHSLQQLTTPGAIDETHTIDLGGVPQVVSIRGRDRANPVLLFVHGGPGTPLTPTAWMWQRPVEEYFTVVHYDQRGAGRSFRLTDSAEVRATLHVERYVQDCIELVEWLRRELTADRVTIAGHSWGTVVATTAALERPELFTAYLGIGQVVNFRAGEGASYAWACDEAHRRADAEALAELESIAPYPGDGPLDLDKVITERTWVQRFGGFAAGRGDCDYYTEGEATSLDYRGEDLVSTWTGNSFSIETLLPRLADVDLTRVTEFPIPIVQFLGRHDQMTPADPVARWMEDLSAPSKIVEWFEDSAHMPMHEEPGHFLMALLRHLHPDGL